MKKPANSLYPPDWKKSAKKDWHRINTMLRDNDIEAAAFFLQQTLEKYLKAFLLKSGWKLRKIHDLDALLDDAVKYNPSLESFRGLCKRVSGYYLTERYPPFTPSGLKSPDIKKDMVESKRFIQTMFPRDVVNS